MNELLQLKGRFEQKSSSGRPGSPKLLANQIVSEKKILKLKKELEELKEYWLNISYFEGALISVTYVDIVAKSRRMRELFKKNSRIQPNDCVVGAKFIDKTSTEKQHVITYYVDLDVLDESINTLNVVASLLIKDFNGEISTEKLNSISDRTDNYEPGIIARTKFLQAIVDISSIENFAIPKNELDELKTSIISIFDTKVPTSELLKRVGLNVPDYRVIDKTTILLTPDQLEILNEKAPYLISMATTDLSKLDTQNFEIFDRGHRMTIPSPTDEPVVGVIDTMFDTSVYFSEWVTFQDKVNADIPINSTDYEHGTAVSSLIVDGASINPELDDGCGRFRVKHFGVARGSKFSSFSILKSIKEIVADNRDIKVWNLSLGSALEIQKNFISPEAALLDKIQYEFDVIFVIAGTNKRVSDKARMKIGAPADSINSLVVNAVDKDNKPATYSREGKVLSFFNKPDISYFGGDGKNKIRVCMPTGEYFVAGTSFAAPWITRKIAYLIHKIGLSREVAKALIIDSAISWSKPNSSMNLIGYGVVPQKIEDVLNAQDDEIKFVISGESIMFDTYNYNLPVPVVDDKHPYIAKATLCYFPKCSRNQGVDYTNTELDIYFGRLNGQKIITVNDNKQNDNVSLSETDARGLYRKWDNIKSIIEYVKPNGRAKKAYGDGLWGFSLKTKERLNNGDGRELRFGIVVTLKEMKGINRISDFISQCSMRGWLVNRIDIQEMIDIYNVAEGEINFED